MAQSPYLAIMHEEKKERSRILDLNFQDFIFLLLAFFVGQAQIAGFYFLSIVYLTIMAKSKKALFFLSLFIVGFNFYWTGSLENFTYILASLTAFFLFHSLKNKFPKVDIVILNSFFYLLFAFINNYRNNLLPIHFFITLAEVILIYCICQLAISGFEQIVDKKKHLNALALFTIFIFINIFLIGLSSFDYITYHHINILLLTLIITMANILGLSYSTLAALAFAVVLIAADVIPTNNIFLYVIFSFSSALFSHKKRIWTILAVIISFFLYSGFTVDAYELRNTAIVLMIVYFLFIITPRRIQDYLFSSFLVRGKSLEQLEGHPLASNLQEHLKQLSGVFNQLSKTFSQVIPEERDEKCLEDFAFIFKSKVCGKCKRLNICWQQEKEDIYKRLYFMLKKAEQENSLSVNIISKCFDGKCPYSSQIISSAKVSYEIHQINKFWRNRLKDKQNIVSEQLAGIAEIVNQFSRETSLTTSKETAIDHIIHKASNNDIEIYNLELHSNTNKREYLTVEIEQCSGNSLCQGQFLDIINTEFEDNYRLISKTCGNKIKDLSCQLVYGPVGDYQLKIASMSKACFANVSGDSFLYKKLKDGKDLVVISDGMGVGEKAAVESRAAINLLETIIDAGFDEKIAIKTINSALYLRNQEESFTTLDICIFDTFTGKANFSKIGAVASYIKRGWELVKIDSASLPAGILEKIEVSTKEIKVYPDDYIIMLTDGVMDIREDIKDKEEWLRRIMQNSSFDKAEDMLEYMIESILDYNGEVNDDLTMVVIKIEELVKKSRKFKGLPRINIGK